MFTSIPSLDPVLQCLLPAFTQPSFRTHVEVFLGWVMCLGRRTEYAVFQTIQADTPLSRKRRHPFDRFYNFFSRSAWTVHDLAQRVAPILVVLVRDPRGKFQDKYLFTTDLSADLGWVISTFSRRWSIEVAFKSSKQVMKIEAPQHWCQESIEKLSPWVWLMQSVISLWYFTEGRKLPSARASRRRFGQWDTEWSLGHMLRILRTAILEDRINPTSATKADLHQLLNHLQNYLSLAT